MVQGICEVYNYNGQIYHLKFQMLIADSADEENSSFLVSNFWNDGCHTQIWSAIAVYLANQGKYSVI